MLEDIEYICDYYNLFYNILVHLAYKPNINSFTYKDNSPLIDILYLYRNWIRNNWKI
jgi:hypothetical protein